MAKINNKTAYPFDSRLSLDDFVIGSDANNLDVTRNYKLGSVLTTFKTSLNLASIEYTFSDGTDPELDENDAGYFVTNANQTLAPAITLITLNKIDGSGVDITSLLEVVDEQPTSFTLRISKPSVTGQVFYFSVTAITDNLDNTYSLTVSNFIGSNSLQDGTTYSISFDLSGVPSIYTESDPVFLASPVGSVTTTQVSNWDIAFGWGNHATAGYQNALGGTGIVKSTGGTISYLADNSINWNAAFSWGNHATAGYLTSFTETDPVFSASEAASITAVDTGQWDLAYSWGNHAVAGYITSESDPVFSASIAAGITLVDTQQWDAAYSWGNHATAGYFKTDQTIPQTIINGVPDFSLGQKTAASFYDVNYIPTGSEPAGSLFWNSTDETLDLVRNGTVLQLGQELYIRVRNTSAALIENGKVVYDTGHTGIFPDIALAKADSPLTGNVLGITTEDIAVNGFGAITTYGYVRGIKTNYTGTGIWGTTWAEGDILYVSKDVAGQLTNVEPVAPHHSDRVAIVGVVHPSQGTILVGINRHKTVKELSDVNGTALTTSGQIMTWDNVNQYFDFTNNINDYLLNTTDTLTGDLTVTGNVIVSDEIYGVAWNGSTQVPTKNAIYDKIENLNSSLSNYQLLSEKGQANGYVPLDGGGKIASQYLPAFVDDVLEYANLAAFPATGSSGILYIAADTNFTYRWSGTAYVQIGGGGAAEVDSVFGRVGAITAQVGDYSAFYSQLGHTHSQYLLNTTDVLAGDLTVTGNVNAQRAYGYGTSADNEIVIGGTDNGFVDNGTASHYRALVSGTPASHTYKIQPFLRGTGYVDRYTFDQSGNFTATGGLTLGSNTFTKASVGVGNIALDNGLTDSGGIKFYQGNNDNFGIDVFGGYLRVVKNLDETGGAELIKVTNTGNFTATGQGNFNTLFSTNDITRGFDDASTSGVILKTISANPIVEFQRWGGVTNQFRGTRIIKELDDIVIQNATLNPTATQTFTERFRLSELGNFTATGTGSFGGATLTHDNGVNYGQIEQLREVGGNNFKAFLAVAGGTGYSVFGNNAVTGGVTKYYEVGGTDPRYYDGAILRKIWHEGNDGTGSGLDADLLDGRNSSDFLLNVDTRYTGDLDSLAGNSSTIRDLGSNANSPSGQSFGSILQINNIDVNAQLYFGRSNGGVLFYRGNNGSSLVGTAWNEVWSSGNDGAGSGLDADLLDGLQSSTTSAVNTIVARDGFSNIAVANVNCANGVNITGGLLNHTGADSRDKIRVWSSGLYAIGMGNSYTYGGLNNNFAMSFQMNNDSGRGFWWGDDAHTKAQGAMSLTTDGTLTVAQYMRLGYGESDTTRAGTTYRLQVNGTIQASNFILSSDERYKSNIKPYQPKKIDVNWFNFTYDNDESSRTQLGTIAQDLEKRHPEFIVTEENGDKSVEYIQVLIAKVAEQEEEINELKTRMDRLEMIIKELL